MLFNIVSSHFVSKVYGYKESKKMIGGLEVYLLELCRLLLKEGHDVKVIEPGIEDKEYNFNGIRIRELKVLPSMLSNLRRYGSIRVLAEVSFNFRWTRGLDKNVDRIHLHSYRFAYPFGNERVTGTCHGVEWDLPIAPTPHQPLYRWYLRFTAKHAVQRLGKIAANDMAFIHFVQSEMPHYRHKIMYIPNFVNVNIFNPNVKPKFKDKRPVVLFPRRLDVLRGALLTVFAIQKLKKRYPNILCLMVGEGPHKSLVINKIKHLKLEDNIKLLGLYPHEEMPSIYRSADIVIIPSIGCEGTSLSCLEAMACEKPVVATRVGGLPDIVIDGFNGFLCYPDPESLAEKLSIYLEDKQLRKKHATIARKWVAKHFSLEVWQKRYKLFFNI